MQLNMKFSLNIIKYIVKLLYKLTITGKAII